MAVDGRDQELGIAAGAGASGGQARGSVPIAIVGLSGRYPKSPDLDALWANLKNGVDCVGEVDGSRWDLGFHIAESASSLRVYTRAGGFLDRIDQFDAEFFGMSPREARQVDPQHRLLLELAWEAMEDANIVPAAIAGSRTGVFVGISGNDYATLSDQKIDAYSNIGSALSIAANRISYVFDLHGPSMSIDTACSSSIVALHQACRSIAVGDCSMALVGGINILASMRPFAGFAQASMLSPDGRCKSFDADGKGYVRAEGGGVVILKPLADAERDGDQILAVIVGTSVNSDGKTMGMALPSGEAQESLLRQIYTDHGVAPEDVFYVEAHGTGTAAGDPIECGAIGRVLGAPRQDGSHCLIGSIKSNIGHLESGAGMAGLTKLLLAIRHREIPGNLHFNTPNPKIDFEGSRLKVVDRATALPDSAKPLTFGINSFGFGGTNAHAILREYRKPAAEVNAPEAPGPTATEGWGNLLPLSAQSTAALTEYARLHADRVRDLDAADFRDYCATAALMRSQHGHRLIVQAASAKEAAERLDLYVAEGQAPGVVQGRAAGTGKTAFVFSGNGPQWWGMGRELLAESQIFRDELTAIDATFQTLAGWSLVEMMQRPQDQVNIGLTEIAQPLLFAQQVAICAVLRAAGITPAAVFGHSVGEAAAAHLSGALTREQATTVIFQRSQLQALTAGRGRMAAISLSREEAEAYLSEIDGWLEIAAVNAPKAVTVAGALDALEELCDRLTDEGRFARILPLNYAFHTSAMDSIEAPLREHLATLKPGETQVPFISTVEGATLPGTTLDADYWWRNIRAPVLFESGVRTAVEEHGIDLFVEIGPHPVLRDYVAQTVKTCERSTAVALATLRRPSDKAAAPEVETLRAAIAAVYAAGGGDLKTLYAAPARPAKLPLYPWNRAVHWRGAWDLPDAVPVTRRDHLLLGHRTPSHDGVWTNTIQPILHGFLLDHVVQGSAIFPAAGYLELALATALPAPEGTALDLETVEILKPLVLAEDLEPIVQLTLDAADGTFRIRSRGDAEATAWTEHCKGRVLPVEAFDAPAPLDLEALRRSLPVVLDSEAHYQACHRRGMSYGPHFQGVREVRLTAPDAAKRMALGDIHVPDAEANAGTFRSHPSVFDCCLQLLISIVAQNDPRDSATIPIQMAHVRSYAPLPAHVFCSVTLTHESDRTGVADMVVTDAEGNVLMTMTEGRFQKVEFRPSMLPITAEDWRPDPAWTVRNLRPLAIPSPRRLVDATATAADGTAAVRPLLDRLIGLYAAKALETLVPTGRPFTVAALMRDLAIDPAHETLLESLVAMAEADGYLQISPIVQTAIYSFTAGTSVPDPEELRRALMLDHPGYSAELVAIGRAGGQLVATLTGPSSAAPAVAMQDVLDDTAPSRAGANAAAAALLRTTLAAWPKGRPVRIVEIGGGTGGLTASLLPVLPPEHSDYLFVDASEQATIRAGNRFADFHFFRTAASETDALGETGFDMVIASAPVAPGIAHRLLAPGGLILALEAQPGRFASLLTGAGQVRGATAAVEALVAGGFEDASVMAASDTAGHAIILARKPESAAQASTPELPQVAGERVLVLSDAETGTAFVAGLEKALTARGQTVRRHVVTAQTLTDEAMTALVAAYPQATEFVHLAGWAATGTAGADVLERQDIRCLSAVQLARAIELRPVGDDAAASPTLTIVTRGAFAAPSGAAPLDPVQATVAGLTRVIANEQTAVGCRLIDVHATADDVEAAGVLGDALLARDDETETLLIDGRRYVHRVRESSIAEQTRIASFNETARKARPFRLDFLPANGVDSLHLREIERRAPGEGEIEIAVKAAGLNFRDVLYTMGMLPDEALEKGFSGPTIGMECAGEVVRVGKGVTAFKPGDRVMAFASSCFASHVTTSADSAGLVPAGLSYAEAATVPTTFITAWYALDHLARLEPGEQVLIHGAAGGVGLAALQIAKMKGATVFATAGSPDKQKLVKTMGADHVLSSRSLKFADDIMRLTDGKGIDVVLNSLAGEAINKGLQVLKPFGRFLEIGKRDFYGNSRIGLRPFRQNLSYFGIDADTLLVERAPLARRLFGAVLQELEAGRLKPLPHIVTPIARAKEAFRAMQQARHVGKLVIGLDGEPHERLPVVARGTDVIRPDVTYLVTGGLSGFGLATAEWLVRQGARSLALLGRRGDTTEEAQAGLARIRKAGANARAFAVDVADRMAIEAVVAEVRATMPPLKGVIHSAAVIEDAPLIKVDRDLMRNVMSAKMLGAWHLHEATLADELDIFVMYSSSSALVGNPGQAVYVAANAFLNALAEHRRASGLPALSVGWGAIKDVGFLTRNTHVEEMLENRAGMGATPAAVILAELGRLMAAGACNVSAAQFNLMRLGRSLPGARSKRFSMLIPAGMVTASQNGESMAEALAAMNDEGRRAAIMACVAENVARVVGSPVSQIEPGSALSELGLDSLMAVELAEALEQTIGRPVSVMQMIQAGTVEGVVEVVARAFVTRDKADPVAEAAPSEPRSQAAA